MKWDFEPAWSDRLLFNAMAETLLEKKTRKDLGPRNCCIVLADGYFEWLKFGPKNDDPLVSLPAQKVDDGHRWDGIVPHARRPVPPVAGR